MKKTQTAISSSIGNQDNKIPRREGILSSSGDATMLTPLLDNCSTRLG
jgi:hypothetical protein